jgi:cell wall-associated NlpC family hydrolase
MSGRHRKPSPARELIPTAAGATVTALTLVTTTGTLPAITAPVKTEAVTQPIRRSHPVVPHEPLMMLAPPMLAPASVEWYPSYAPPPRYYPQQRPIVRQQPRHAAPATARTATPAPAQAPAPRHAAPEHAETPAPRQLPVTQRPVLTAAVKAVDTALGQQGVPYVYGGATPGRALDCSALVQYAYRQAGINLPRTAGEQAQHGTTVPLSQVQKGDLLFYYAPISHVAIALGDGKVIEASQPGHPVSVHSLYTNGLSVIKRLVN